MIVVVEDDPFPRMPKVMLDPAASPESFRAVADFFAHDEPAFVEWCNRLRAGVQRMYVDVARVQIVDRDALISALRSSAHCARDS